MLLSHFVYGEEQNWVRCVMMRYVHLIQWSLCPDAQLKAFARPCFSANEFCLLLSLFWVFNCDLKIQMLNLIIHE